MNTFVVDTTAPVLSQVTAVTTPNNITTPGYAFSSNEVGTILYSGSCSSGTTSASNGTNSISFNTLSDASYSDCNITVTDSAGNASSALSVNTFVVDTTGPTVSSVTSSNDNGSYKLNDNITINVTFNDTVYVDNSNGNPIIQLETGENDRYAYYISGSNSNVLSFLYTIRARDNSIDLDYISSNSFLENSATITDNLNNDATLTLPTPGSSGSLGDNKDFLIKTWRGTVSFDSTNKDYIEDLKIGDTTQNIYLFGRTFGSIDNTTKANSANYVQDVFISKTSDTGEKIWTIQLDNDWVSDWRGSYCSNKKSFTIDKHENIYFARVKTNGEFILNKYSDNSSEIWSKTITLSTSPENLLISSMDVDSGDNIYIVGGSPSLNSFYLIKLNSSGDLIYEKSMNNSGTGACQVMVDEGYHGGIYVTGTIWQTDRYDAFLAKYDFYGNRQDIQYFGTPGNDYPQRMTNDLWSIIIVGTTENTFFYSGHKPGSTDIFLHSFLKGSNGFTKKNILEFGGSSADSISSIHVSGGTHYSDYDWLSSYDLSQIQGNRVYNNSTFRVNEYAYPSLYVTGYVENEISDTIRVEYRVKDENVETINKINNYSNVYGDSNTYDSFIAKFSQPYAGTGAATSFGMDWFKYLDFNGNESHNYFDINSEGELIMGINIDNSSSVDGASYIIKSTDNGTIIN